MSVEALVVAAVVEDGASALRKLYAAGCSANDFPIYDAEFDWVEKRIVNKKTINRRVFRQRFPDFEWQLPNESIQDLASELKEERAFEAVNALVSSLSEQLERDNAIELATSARELLSQITRHHAPMSDFLLEDWKEDVAEMRRLMRLAKTGQKQGLSSGFAHLDFHWGGLMPGQFIEILGRTGEGKSLKTIAMALSAKLQDARVGIFTPEMSKHEVKCRLHTLASARKEVQEACGLERSFRNRALMFRRGFNLKSYERFCQYFDEELPGRTFLLSGSGRPEQMTVGFIEDRVVELALDFVIVDPIYLLRPVRMTKSGDTYQEIAWTAEALHRLGETYNIPIVFTNQAHLDGARDDAPDKTKSFGAKALAHLSDYVLGVRHMSNDNRMMCKCSKSRFGENNFRYEIAMYANTGVIKELTPMSGQSYFNGKDTSADDDDVRAAIASVDD